MPADRPSRRDRTESPIFVRCSVLIDVYIELSDSLTQPHDSGMASSPPATVRRAISMMTPATSAPRRRAVSTGRRSSVDSLEDTSRPLPRVSGRWSAVAAKVQSHRVLPPSSATKGSSGQATVSADSTTASYFSTPGGDRDASSSTLLSTNHPRGGDGSDSSNSDLHVEPLVQTSDLLPLKHTVLWLADNVQHGTIVELAVLARLCRVWYYSTHHMQDLGNACKPRLEALLHSDESFVTAMQALVRATGEPSVTARVVQHMFESEQDVLEVVQAWPALLWLASTQVHQWLMSHWPAARTALETLSSVHVDTISTAPAHTSCVHLSTLVNWLGAAGYLRGASLSDILGIAAYLAPASLWLSFPAALDLVLCLVARALATDGATTQHALDATLRLLKMTRSSDPMPPTSHVTAAGHLFLRYAGTAQVVQWDPYPRPAVLECQAYLRLLHDADIIGAPVTHVAAFGVYQAARSAADDAVSQDGLTLAIFERCVQHLAQLWYPAPMPQAIAVRHFDTQFLRPLVEESVTTDPTLLPMLSWDVLILLQRHDFVLQQLFRAYAGVRDHSAPTLGVRLSPPEVLSFLKAFGVVPSALQESQVQGIFDALRLDAQHPQSITFAQFSEMLFHASQLLPMEDATASPALRFSRLLQLLDPCDSLFQHTPSTTPLYATRVAPAESETLSISKPPSWSALEVPPISNVETAVHDSLLKLFRVLTVHRTERIDCIHFLLLLRRIGLITGRLTHATAFTFLQHQCAADMTITSDLFVSCMPFMMQLALPMHSLRVAMQVVATSALRNQATSEPAVELDAYLLASIHAVPAAKIEALLIQPAILDVLRELEPALAPAFVMFSTPSAACSVALQRNNPLASMFMSRISACHLTLQYLGLGVHGLTPADVHECFQPSELAPSAGLCFARFMEFIARMVLRLSPAAVASVLLSPTKPTDSSLAVGVLATAGITSAPTRLRVVLSWVRATIGVMPISAPPALRGPADVKAFSAALFQATATLMLTKTGVTLVAPKAQVATTLQPLLSGTAVASPVLDTLPALVDQDRHLQTIQQLIGSVELPPAAAQSLLRCWEAATQPETVAEPSASHVLPLRAISVAAEQVLWTVFCRYSRRANHNTDGGLVCSAPALLQLCTDYGICSLLPADDVWALLNPTDDANAQEHAGYSFIQVLWVLQQLADRIFASVDPQCHARFAALLRSMDVTGALFAAQPERIVIDKDALTLPAPSDVPLPDASMLSVSMLSDDGVADTAKPVEAGDPERRVLRAYMPKLLALWRKYRQLDVTPAQPAGVLTWTGLHAMLEDRMLVPHLVSWPDVQAQFKKHSRLPDGTDSATGLFVLTYDDWLLVLIGLGRAAAASGNSAVPYMVEVVLVMLCDARGGGIVPTVVARDLSAASPASPNKDGAGKSPKKSAKKAGDRPRRRSVSSERPRRPSNASQASRTTNTPAPITTRQQTPAKRRTTILVRPQAADAVQHDSGRSLLHVAAAAAQFAAHRPTRAAEPVRTLALPTVAPSVVVPTASSGAVSPSDSSNMESFHKCALEAYDAMMEPAVVATFTKYRPLLTTAMGTVPVVPPEAVTALVRTCGLDLPQAHITAVAAGHNGSLDIAGVEECLLRAALCTFGKIEATSLATSLKRLR